MSSKFEFIKDSIPEDGVAHLVPNFGKVVVTPDLRDELIEALPEGIQEFYFRKKV